MTFTTEQDFAYARLSGYENSIGKTVAQSNAAGNDWTIGTEDATGHWHPSEDEQAYRWWTPHNDVPLQSYVYPTSYRLNDAVSNGYSGVRLFDFAGNWLGTPNNPVKAPEPEPAPAPVAAIVASAAAEPQPAPAPQAVAAVVDPKPALIGEASALPPSAPASVIVHVHPAQTTATPTEVHVHFTAPVATTALAPDSVVPVAAPAPAPKRGFWAWIARLFSW